MNSDSFSQIKSQPKDFENFQHEFLENHQQISILEENSQTSVENRAMPLRYNIKSMKEINISSNFNEKPFKINEETKRLTECRLSNLHLWVVIKNFIKKLKFRCSLRSLQYMNQSSFRLLGDKTCFYHENLSKKSKKTKKNVKKFPRFRKFLKILVNFYTRNIKKLSRNSFVIRLKNTHFILHPFSLVKLLWDFLNVCSIFFWLFLIPLGIAFEEMSMFMNEIFLYSLFFWIFDIIVKFNTGFFRKGILEMDKGKIAVKYIKTNLFYDIVTLLAISLDVILEHGLFASKMIKFVFFLKIMDLEKVIHCIFEKFLLREKLQNLMSLMKVFFISFLTAHIFACFWYFSSKFGEPTKNWVAKAEIMDASLSTKYLYSFYWSIATMMTVGYGDISPTNESEMIVCLISIILGCVVYAYNINSVGMILQNINKGYSEFQHKINIINQFMGKKKISVDLQRRIREYLRFIWQEENIQDLKEENEIFNLLSNNLREELLMEAYSDIMKKTPMFYANFSEKTLRKAVTIIRDHNLFPNEEVFSMNEEDNCSVFFIKKGNIELFTEAGVLVKTLGKGDYFGEIAFFTGNKRVLSARCKDFTTLYSLPREEFIEILRKNIEDYEKFCMIRDQICIYENYLPIKTRCFSCLQIGHISRNCNLIHFVPDREKIIKTMNFYQDDERKAFQRKIIKINSLGIKNQCNVAAKIIKAEMKAEKRKLKNILNFNNNNNTDTFFSNATFYVNNTFSKFEKSEKPSSFSKNKEKEVKFNSEENKNDPIPEEKTNNKDNDHHEDDKNNKNKNEVSLTESIEIRSLKHLDHKNSQTKNSNSNRENNDNDTNINPDNNNIINRNNNANMNINNNINNNDSFNIIELINNKEKIISQKSLEEQEASQQIFTEVSNKEEEKGSLQVVYPPSEPNSSHFSQRKFASELNVQKILSAIRNDLLKFVKKNEKGCETPTKKSIQKEPSHFAPSNISLTAFESQIQKKEDQKFMKFDSVTKFKNYFPNGNAQLIFEKMNKNQNRASMSQMIRRNRRLDQNLSKYTFFTEKMKRIVNAPKKIKAEINENNNISIFKSFKKANTGKSALSKIKNKLLKRFDSKFRKAKTVVKK